MTVEMKIVANVVDWWKLQTLKLAMCQSKYYCWNSLNLIVNLLDFHHFDMISKYCLNIEQLKCDSKIYFWRKLSHHSIALFTFIKIEITTDSVESQIHTQKTCDASNQSISCFNIVEFRVRRNAIISNNGLL